MTPVGVDGCKAGWVALVGEPPVLHVFASFEALLAHGPAAARIAVDMPIGLPDRIQGAGRAPEQLVRPLLGARQSSVFAIPARAAVELGSQMTGKIAQDHKLHKRASALARTLSDPAKGVSIQGFYLFPKILEIDGLLRADPALRGRVHESHPEVAFMVLNGGQAMSLPKKVKGKVHEAGMEERRALLARHGLEAAFLSDKPPPGVGLDDVLDAAVCWLVARRLIAGQAISYPAEPECDGKGIPIAIWA